MDDQRRFLLVSNLADTASRVIEHMQDVDSRVSKIWPDLSEIRRRLVEIETEARDKAVSAPSPATSGTLAGLD